MKIAILILTLSCIPFPVFAQAPLSRDEALKQIYNKFDPEKKTAQWVCSKGQDKSLLHDGWPCRKEDSTVSVSILLSAEVAENGLERVYFASSAKPANDPLGYECHACRPAIGAGVFEWKEGRWELQSVNPAVGFYGGYGSPPEIDFVTVGPEKHGLMLSTGDLAQGYAFSGKVLLLPIGQTVCEVWSIGVGSDNEGAYEPADKSQVAYSSSAALNFTYSDSSEGSPDYYDIEVLSRGQDRKDLNHPVRAENWTEIYRFTEGKYRLLRHIDFVETRGQKRISTK